MTSSSTPSWEYSFFRVLKQCAQVETILRALVSLNTSAFCIASCWKTNSLPDRRAGSPVQVSPSPSTAKLTPAMFSSSATACVVFFARSSKAPAQPTQNRYSTSSSDSTSAPTCLTSKGRSLAQSIRPDGFMFHGLPLFSRPLKSWLSSDGNDDSISTWWRRMSMIASTCSMSTGHCCTQAPHDVHAQSASSSMTATSGDPTSGLSSSASTSSGKDLGSPSEDARRYGALLYACSRRFITTSFGDSGLSVFQAGHCDWPRPHSVQVVKSSRPFQVKSSILPTPSGESSSSSSMFSKSIGLPLTLIGCSAPSAVPPSALRLNQMFGQAVNRCQATPIVAFSEIVIIQENEIRILIIAIR